MRTSLCLSLVAVLCILLCILPPADAAASPQAVEVRVAEILGKMTLEEKLGQLQQIDGMVDGTARPEFADLARKGYV